METDGYAVGITLAMALVGKPVQETLMLADGMFEEPTTAAEVTDAAAGWPEQTAIEVARLVKGLVVPRLRDKRTPLSAALQKLEDLTTMAECRNGSAAPPEIRECLICMVRARGE